MMVGCPPFSSWSNDNTEIYKQIRTEAVEFPDAKRDGIPMSDECKDFIAKLLDKKADSRLGTDGGYQTVLAHPWL